MWSGTVTDASFANQRRYLSLWFLFLSAERLERTKGWTGAGRVDTPLVLVEPVKGSLCLAGLNRQALALGLKSGLTLADARARIPNLIVAEHDPAADNALISQIADDSDRWTPLVALDLPHGLILDITGCAHLFGGEVGLRSRLCKCLHRAGLTVGTAVAGTPEAARAIARFGDERILSCDGETDYLRHLPIAALESSEDTLAALKRVGFQRVGDLIDRLVARFGPARVFQFSPVNTHDHVRAVQLTPATAALDVASP
jgi:protein ImuB